MKEYYPYITRRKSVRKYDEKLSLSEAERTDITAMAEALVPLIPDIKTRVVLLRREDTTAKRGEYCLCLYSEKKPGYCLNAGYMLQQADLWFCERDIGACWYGLARALRRELDGLYYTVMLAIGKSSPDDFRNGEGDFNRHEAAQIWSGDVPAPELLRAVRLAPSACNSQPWRVVCDGDRIAVSRDPRTRSMIPVKLRPFFNRIDVGIALCHLEAAAEYLGLKFERRVITEGTVVPRNESEDGEQQNTDKTELCAEYRFTYQ